MGISKSQGKQKSARVSKCMSSPWTRATAHQSSQICFSTLFSRWSTPPYPTNLFNPDSSSMLHTWLYRFLSFHFSSFIIIFFFCLAHSPRASISILPIEFWRTISARSLAQYPIRGSLVARSLKTKTEKQSLTAPPVQATLALSHSFKLSAQTEIFEIGAPARIPNDGPPCRASRAREDLDEPELPEEEEEDEPEEEREEESD